MHAFERPVDVDGLRGEVEQVARDVELIAEQTQRLQGEMERRIDGVRSDFEIALLQQLALIVRRFERIEQLVAEKVAADADVARALLPKLGGGR